MRKAAALLLLAACAHGPPPGPPGQQLELTFTDYSPLSRTEEIARRTLTPITYLRLEQFLASKGRAMSEQPIDLAREKFSVYVPAGAPPKAGYGLLVFISPGPEAPRPQQWRRPLDRHGLIFVAAVNSGNDVKILDRRLPLALLAYENVRARYPLDPKRVFVGGLSGGSRAAEVTALAYPDVFRGALLNAGSDPIGGEQGIYLPPADLFEKFQHTKLVYVTGDKDDLNLHDDEMSRASMRDFCVLNVEIKVARGLGHESLDPISLSRALDALDAPSIVDDRDLARCNANLQRELAAKLAGVEAALARGDREGARAGINAIDAHYAGLAAKALLELDAKLAARK